MSNSEGSTEMPTKFTPRIGTAHIEISDIRAAIMVYFETETERDAFAKSLPKWIGTYFGYCLDYDTGATIPFAAIDANLTANGTNGGINETGIKRTRRFLSAITNLPITYGPFSKVTVEEFLGDRA